MGGNNVFNQYGGTIGNAAAGPVNSQHATVAVAGGQSAADVLAILEAVAQLGWMPPEFADESNSVADELRAAAGGTADSTPAIGRAGRLFTAVSTFANTNPAAVALLTAGGNLVAIKLGLATG